MAAKMGILGLILSFYPYLSSAMVRFPLKPTLLPTYDTVVTVVTFLTLVTVGTVVSVVTVVTEVTVVTQNFVTKTL